MKKSLAVLACMLGTWGCSQSPTPQVTDTGRYVMVPLETTGELFLLDTRLGITWRRVQAGQDGDRQTVAWIAVDRMTEAALLGPAAGPPGDATAGSKGIVRVPMTAPATGDLRANLPGRSAAARSANAGRNVTP